MTNIQKTGALAAVVNAFLGTAMLLVIFRVIGPDPRAEYGEFIETAFLNPAPLFLQEVMKFVSAAFAGLIVFVLAKRLRDANPFLVYTGTIFGVISILLLVANATVSFYTVSEAMNFGRGVSTELNQTITALGTASIMIYGGWYLFVNWVGLKSQRLPKGLAILGLAIGVSSLVPMLFIFVLLLTMIWSLWLGLVFLQHE